MLSDAAKIAVGATGLRPSDFHVYRSPAVGPLLFHAPSLRIFSISPALAGCLGNLAATSDRSQQSAHQRHSQPQLHGAALAELAELLRAGQEGAPAATDTGPTDKATPSPSEWNPADHPWANLTLLVTDRCNLRCGYCYEAYGSYKQAGRTISREVAAAALDFFFDQLYPCAEVYDLHLFGGEPLLAWETVEWVTHQAKARAETKGLPGKGGPAALYLSLSTNAIGLTKQKAAFLREHEFDVSVSLDGPADVHDESRRFRNGRGSFAAVERGFAHLLDGRPPYSSISARLHRRNTDVYQSLLAAYQVSGEGKHGISFELARLSPSHPLSLRQEDVEAILCSYRPALELVLERLAAGDYSHFIALLYGNDYIARFVMRLLSRDPERRRCGAGCDEYIVATDGSIYPCEVTVGMEDQRLGDVWGGISPERHRLWLGLEVDGRDECRDCWARYLCGGGCYASALLAHGDLGRPAPLDCRFTRGLIELVMEFFVRAEAKAPGGLYRALCQALAKAPQKHQVFVPAPIQGVVATG